MNIFKDLWRKRSAQGAHNSSVQGSSPCKSTTPPDCSEVGADCKDAVRRAIFPLLLQAVYNAGILLAKDVNRTYWKCTEGAYTGGMMDCKIVVDLLDRFGISPRKPVTVLNDDTVVFHHVFRDEAERIYERYAKTGSFDERKEEQDAEYVDRLVRENESLRKQVGALTRRNSSQRNEISAYQRKEGEYRSSMEFRRRLRAFRDKIESVISTVRDEELKRRFRMAMSPCYRLEVSKAVEINNELDKDRKGR